MGGGREGAEEEDEGKVGGEVDLFARTWESLDFGVVLERLSGECRTEMGRAKALVPDFKATLEEVRRLFVRLKFTFSTINSCCACRAIPAMTRFQVDLSRDLEILFEISTKKWRPSCYYYSTGSRGKSFRCLASTD